jgi:hypothetical protein
MADVVSQMAGSILDQEDVDEVLAECDEGSVGSQIRHWVELAFPGQQLASVKALRDQNPGVFRAAILAASDPGGVR